jgi:hypothetical protein
MVIIEDPGTILTLLTGKAPVTFEEVQMTIKKALVTPEVPRMCSDHEEVSTDH